MLRITTRATIALATLCVLAACNRKDATERETTTMATAPQNITVKSSDGTEISYDKVGSGPVLIVVTGASHFRKTDPHFAELARILSDQFTVINYDRRGRGMSGDNPPYSVRKEIDDIAALIAANGDRASLLGYSSGAVLAIEVAVAGLPVHKVIAYEPPIVVEGSGRDPDRSDLVPRLDAALARGDRREVIRIFFVESVGLSPEMYEGMMDSPAGEVNEAIAPTFIYDSRIVDGAYPHQKWPERYRTNKVPVLLLDGDQTFPFIPLGVNALSKVLANSSRKTLPGQDHGPKPEAIAPVIREFLGANLR
jgi:pimeloyl-ACP methyl ester carboxylesterase